jgi:hypothetical protein
MPGEIRDSAAARPGSCGGPDRGCQKYPRAGFGRRLPQCLGHPDGYSGSDPHGDQSRFVCGCRSVQRREDALLPFAVTGALRDAGDDAQPAAETQRPYRQRATVARSGNRLLSRIRRPAVPGSAASASASISAATHWRNSATIALSGGQSAATCVIKPSRCSPEGSCARRRAASIKMVNGRRRFSGRTVNPGREGPRAEVRGK